MAKKALGKGLSSIFEDMGTPVINNETESYIHEILLGDITPNPFQPRRQFREEELKELSDSIEQNGLLSPILVREHQGKYQIIAGERRFRASQKLGKETILAHVREKVSDRDMMELSLIENIQRVQLSPVEEAEAYMQLIESCGLTHENLSEKLAKSRSAISNTLRLLKLAEPVKGLIREGKLSAGHARTLVQYEEKEQIAMAQKIVNEGLNVRSAENLSSKKKNPKVSGKLDPNLTEFLENLKFALGTKIQLQGNSNKGKIEIHFNSHNQLIDISKIFVSKLFS